MTVEAADMMPSQQDRQQDRWPVKRRRILAGGLAALVFTARPLKATTAASSDASWQRMQLGYLVRAGGVDVARADFNAEWDGDRLTSELVIENTGPARWFNEVRSAMKGEARLIRNTDTTTLLLPVQFHSKHENSSGKRRVGITYDGAGQISSLDYRRDGKPRDSKVPPEMWTDTMDPLTAIASIWERVRRDGLPSEAAGDVAIFDGRKRYDVHIEQYEREGAGNPFDGDAIELSARRTPIAGFDEDDDEWRQYLQGEPVLMQFFASADGRAIPYLAVNPQDSVDQEARLSRYCLNGACTTIGN